MKAVFIKFGFFLILISGIIAIDHFYLLGESGSSRANYPSYKLFISEIEEADKLGDSAEAGDRSFVHIPGNSFHAYRPHQKFLLKIEFQNSLHEDNLLLQISPITTLLTERIYSKDFYSFKPDSSALMAGSINSNVSGIRLQQKGESKSPVLYIEASNGLSEVISVRIEKYHEANGMEYFNTGLFLGVAFVSALLSLFFYFQYKQNIFILLDAFLVSLVLKFLLNYALIPGDFLEFLGSISQLEILNSIFYFLNILQSLFLIYFVKIIIQHKYIYRASFINLLIYLIYVLSNSILYESILLNIYYVVNYILIFSIFIIYTKELKINIFMYFIGYGIQFFALYLLAIQYELIDSPIDYSYCYFIVLPIAYLIFFMYVLAHHYHLMLNNKIYEQNELSIKAAYQLELSKSVSDSQVLLLEAISHEIKSPLMALYFLTDGLSSAGEGLTRATQRMRSTLNQISYVVERFSSLSKFYSISELDIKKNIDVQLLIASLLEIRPEGEGIYLQAKVDAKVESDYVLLQIIFQNLIENAIKYRMDSGSPINILITKYKENTLKVDVSNSLSKNVKVDLEKVFDMYYRGGNIKNEPGMGIGLWITKEIAKKVNGEITAFRDDERIVFRVSIPIQFPT